MTMLNQEFKGGSRRGGGARGGGEGGGGGGTRGQDSHLKNCWTSKSRYTFIVDSVLKNRDPENLGIFFILASCEMLKGAIQNLVYSFSKSWIRPCYVS